MNALLERFLPSGKATATAAASVGLGILVGLVVSVFEYLTLEALFHNLSELSLWVKAFAPFVGLVISALVLKTIGGGVSASTFRRVRRCLFRQESISPPTGVAGSAHGRYGHHRPGRSSRTRGPFNLCRIGHWSAGQCRVERWLGRDGAKMLLTAGAAAGVAAVFQAPATGVIFALEAPYRDDLAHRALLPALLASASSYITFTSVPFVHPAPLLGQAFPLGLGAGDLVAAVAIGVGAGAGGRAFAGLTRRAKKISKETSPAVLLLGGGAILGGLAVLSDRIFGDPLTLGPGVNAVEWLADDRSIALVAMLFLFRAIATLVTIGSGGVGGMFIPLAVQGVLLGRLVGVSLEEIGINPEGIRVLPILGLAAFLAAGYRTPIAAVMFVAESTGNSGQAVVPALIAAAVSQLVAGRHSVTAGQRIERLGHLESRFEMPVAAALTTDVLTVPPDATVSEFVWIHALGRRQTVVPVVDGEEYLGLCTVEDCAQVDRDEWENITVGEIATRDLPSADPSWTLRDVVAAMEAGGTDTLAVTDSSGAFVGVVFDAEIIKLGEILDETGAG